LVVVRATQFKTGTANLIVVTTITVVVMAVAITVVVMAVAITVVVPTIMAVVLTITGDPTGGLTAGTTDINENIERA
jgi:hypothetical protein